MLTPDRNPENLPAATVPEQPEAKAPLGKKSPILWVLVAVVGLFVLSNLWNFVSGHKNVPAKSTLAARPSTSSPQQVSTFQTQQELQAKRDQFDALQKEQADAMLQASQDSAPGPEAAGTPAMTPAQRATIYGASPNAPAQTSGASEARAEATQRELARKKARQDALQSDTVAIDFAQPDVAPKAMEASTTAPAQPSAPTPGQPALQPVNEQKAQTLGDPIDSYDGKLYRIFEGTVFEGVVTNHINGALAGPIMVMLTTDYYSHDHQQLLLPQGTRLIGEVKQVNGQQQTRLAVSFHRAICPDGFSIELDKYVGLDPLGTTGLSGKVDHGYLQAFAAAAAIGGLGGLAQIGNSASILDPSSEIRNGVSEQSSQEAEQILNHFLNRLPIITLKEGSRARVYIGTDIYVPSYAEHRVDPTL